MHVAIVALAALVLAGPAAAQPLTCRSAKLQAASKAVAALLKCDEIGAKKGLATDAACVSKGTAKLASAFASAQGKDGCGPDDGIDRLTETVLDVESAAALRLRPTTVLSQCQAAKLRAAGRRASGTLKAHAKNLKKFDVAKLQPTVQKLRAKYDAAIPQAEAKGGCLTTGDAVAVAGATDAALDVVMTAVRVVERATQSQASPVAPPNTPGSPAVTATYPKLDTVLGPGASLNNVTWTRWYLNDLGLPPAAVLIAVPGFGAGAGNFEVLAENLLTRMLEDHGLVVELWGYDRRTEQLEDRAGALIAGAQQNAQIALDWYYGAELALTLHPALNRRAVFFNTSNDAPFIANWTSLVFSRDIDVVVAAANAASGGNAFLAGHSAGTGFAARYAATDFNLSGVGAADPGYERLRGLVLLEGGGGTTATTPLTADALDRIEAKANGGLFGAVRDAANRCVDGTTPCTIANEAVNCVNQVPPVCTPTGPAHGVILGISPKILASAEPGGVQGITDPDTGRIILQVDQGSPGNNAIAVVPELGLLSFLVPAPATVDGLFGAFLDDDGVPASLPGGGAALATSLGGPGPVVGGVVTWKDVTEAASFPGLTPNNGAAPPALPGTIWGQEVESVRIDRQRSAFSGVRGANASDWYYPISGLGTTTSPGLCAGTTAGSTCIAGNVGAPCSGDTQSQADQQCQMSISLDSTALSVGRNRRDIENLTQAANVSIPVLGIGGSNGLTPVPGRFTAVAQSFGPCTAASCNGTARVVDANVPSSAFPTFGGTAGGFEVVIAEGYAHVDVVAAEDDATNPVVQALGDFLARNVQ
jgi:pimeloyl-ACP methyl ester carboxylesterase